MQRILPFTLIVLLSASPDAAAQFRPVVDVDLIVGIPQGTFRDHLKNPGFGIDGFIGVGIESTPIVVGADLGILVYGIERRHVPLSTTIPDVTVAVSTQNSIFMGHIVLRLQPDIGMVTPYAEGLIGLKYFFTETSVEDDDRFDTVTFSTTNYDDGTVSYGVGGGLKVAIYERSEGSLTVSGGVKYLLGGTAEYLTRGAIERVGGTVIYHTDRSETDMLIAQLGVAFHFQ